MKKTRIGCLAAVLLLCLCLLGSAAAADDVTAPYGSDAGILSCRMGQRLLEAYPLWGEFATTATNFAATTSGFYGGADLGTQFPDAYLFAVQYSGTDELFVNYYQSSFFDDDYGGLCAQIMLDGDQLPWDQRLVGDYDSWKAYGKALVSYDTWQARLAAGQYSLYMGDTGETVVQDGCDPLLLFVYHWQGGVDEDCVSANLVDVNYFTDACFGGGQEPIDRNCAISFNPTDDFTFATADNIHFTAAGSLNVYSEDVRTADGQALDGLSISPRLTDIYCAPDAEDPTLHHVYTARNIYETGDPTHVLGRAVTRLRITGTEYDTRRFVAEEQYVAWGSDMVADQAEFVFTLQSDGTMQVTDYLGRSDEVVVPATTQQNGVTYPVTSLGLASFRNNQKIVKVTLPEGMVGIGKNAFENCEHLETVVIPESLVIVEAYAFNNCPALSSFSIPAALANIENGAFAGDSALEAFDISPANEVFFSFPVDESTGEVDQLLYRWDRDESGERYITLVCCPAGLRADELRINYDVRVMMQDAFSGCTGLKDVYIASMTTQVQGTGFERCKCDYRLHVYEGSTAAAEAGQEGYPFEYIFERNVDGFAFINSAKDFWGDWTGFTKGYTSVGFIHKQVKQQLIQDLKEQIRQSVESRTRALDPDISADEIKKKVEEMCDGLPTTVGYYVYPEKVEQLVGKTDAGTAFIIWGTLMSKWSGSCYGMSQIALISSLNGPWEELSDFQTMDGQSASSNGTINGLSKPSKSEDVESLVNYYQLMFNLPQFRKYADKIIVSKTSGISSSPDEKKMLAEIVPLLKQGFIVCVDIVEHRNAHSVLLCSIMSEDSDAYYVRVCDPNADGYPTERYNNSNLFEKKHERYAKIAKDFSSFEYSVYRALYRYNYTYEDANLIDYFSGQMNGTIEAIDIAKEEKSVTLNKDAIVRLQNFQQTLTYLKVQNGEIIQKADGVEQLIEPDSADGSGSSETMTFSLPDSFGDYVLTFDEQGTEGTVSVSSADYCAAITASGAGEATLSGKTFSVEANGQQTFSVMFAPELASQGVSGSIAEIVATDASRLTLSGAKGGLKLSSDAVQPLLVSSFAGAQYHAQEAALTGGQCVVTDETLQAGTAAVEQKLCEEIEQQVLEALSVQTAESAPAPADPAISTVIPATETPSASPTSTPAPAPADPAISTAIPATETPSASPTSTPSPAPAQATEAAQPAEDAERFVCDGYTYELVDGCARIVGCVWTAAQVSVPRTLDGVTVLSIGPGAFAGGAVTELNLPETVLYLEQGAITNCPMLQRITFASPYTVLATNAIVGCGAVTLSASSQAEGVRAFAQAEGLAFEAVE